VIVGVLDCDGVVAVVVVVVEVIISVLGAVAAMGPASEHDAIDNTSAIAAQPQVVLRANRQCTPTSVPCKIVIGFLPPGLFEFARRAV
jgi:hypothetical protein